MRLNGWQRLWVVGAVSWGIAITVFASKEFPTAAQYRETWRKFAEVEAPSMVKKGPWYDYCQEQAQKEKNRFEAFLRCEADATRPTAEDKAHYESLIAKGEAEIRDDLPKTQLQAIGTAVLAWLVPAVALYGLGLLFVWIRRGFQP